MLPSIYSSGRAAVLIGRGGEESTNIHTKLFKQKDYQGLVSTRIVYKLQFPEKKEKKTIL